MSLSLRRADFIYLHVYVVDRISGYFLLFPYLLNFPLLSSYATMQWRSFPHRIRGIYSAPSWMTA